MPIKILTKTKGVIILQKFSFKKNNEYILEDGAGFRQPKDEKGNPIVGDDLLRKMADIAVTFEKKNNRPVPIAQQNFIAWLKQAKNQMDKGVSSDEIFRRTIVRSKI